MNEKIKNINKWVPWLLAVIGVIIIGFFISFFHPGRFNWSTIEPWENAYNVSIYSAINASGPAHHSTVFYEQRIGALIGLLILFIVGPSLWIFSEVKNNSLETAPEKSSPNREWEWYAGVMIMMAGFFYAISGSVSEIKDLRLNQIIKQQQEMEYHIHQGLMTRAIQAIQFYYLPAGQGGGGKSFQLFAAKRNTKQVENKKKMNSQKHKIDYIYHTGKFDSVLTIYAIGNMEGMNAGFNNANGKRGKMQYTIEIIPSRKNMIRWRNKAQFIN